MRILISYRTNKEYHPDYQPFHADYIVDLDKLKTFIAGDDSYYAKEAELIMRKTQTSESYKEYEYHDKYTFYDTEWELARVLSEDQKTPADVQIFAYLNS